MPLASAHPWRLGFGLGGGRVLQAGQALAVCLCRVRLAGPAHLHRHGLSRLSLRASHVPEVLPAPRLRPRRRRCCKFQLPQAASRSRSALPGGQRDGSRRHHPRRRLPAGAGRPCGQTLRRRRAPPSPPTPALMESLLCTTRRWPAERLGGDASGVLGLRGRGGMSWVSCSVSRATMPAMTSAAIRITVYASLSRRCRRTAPAGRRRTVCSRCLHHDCRRLSLRDGLVRCRESSLWKVAAALVDRP